MFIIEDDVATDSFAFGKGQRGIVMMKDSGRRLVWFGRWEYPHNNCRYESLFERFHSVEVKRFRLSRSKYWRTAQTLLDVYFLRHLVYPIILRRLQKKYRYLLCTELSQIGYFPGPVVVDDDDPDFTPEHISLLNRPNVVAVVTTSDLLREGFMASGLRKPCFVLPSGVDLGGLDAERSASIKRKLGKRGSTLVTGFAAPRLYVDREVRGQEQRLRSISFLCQAMERVWQQEPGVELWLLGEPSPGVVEYSRMNPRVRLLGYVSHGDILNYVASFDIGTYPRRDGVGGRHSIKLLEMMACGVPIVSTDVAESFLVKRSGSGIVTSTVKEFADAVVTLALDASAREAFGEKGKRFAEGYDWDTLAVRYERDVFDVYCP